MLFIYSYLVNKFGTYSIFRMQDLYFPTVFISTFTPICGVVCLSNIGSTILKTKQRKHKRTRRLVIPYSTYKENRYTIGHIQGESLIP